MAPKIRMVTKSSASSSAKTLSVLRERIRHGAYASNEWLPAERVLAEELGVHRRAVREAIEQLAAEGLVTVRPRCRPVVTAQTASQRASVTETPVSAFPASRLVALVMWHGGFEQGAGAQQRIFWGMNQRIAQAGYHGVFLDLGEEIGTEEENATREAARLRYALEHSFGGIIFYPYAYRSNRALIQEAARRLPLILVDRMVPGIQTDFVGVDNYHAMLEAAQHLISLGHRRIAYAGFFEPINTVQDRLAGYCQAMREASLPEMPLTMTSAAEWPLFDTLFQLAPNQRPTALLCVSDYIAWNAMQRLTALGLRVPEDVALVGFDNIVQTLPGGVGLTTVAQPFEEIGRRAAGAFLIRHADPHQPLQHIELPAALKVRGSSGTMVAIGVPEIDGVKNSATLVQNSA